MGSSVLVSLDEYLQTSYQPDRDYIDGELRERNLGEQPHAHIQIIIGGIFRENREKWGVRPLVEQRVQVYSRRYRVPDLCVVRNTDPKDLIIAFAPLLCIEVLSSEDRFGELQERVDDYAQMGVENIWAIDPWKRRGYYAGSRGFNQPEDGVMRIAGTPISISLVEVFAELDEF
jgi:Uma2 family endonuclease